ncbi:hypothetical protein BIFGAL_03443 [Bifidobacterium gallicum DSM 20093 = LMG 11596]|uniref:Penicillin-binding protein n=2 Tax=Bifidobacterium gallicum TaxID=78342 RepID=D1NUC2_9BIFI|nr:hypothetical protein BIFGAL_03443 [Bifidobacterium gallicum DSM 20093 = LMG 11596]KFI57908.1 penicillin-binding protein [Bifidobacterium gallicum DSM 20093 = LMG 11596]
MAAAVAIVLLMAGGGVFFAYKSEKIGGRTVPVVAQMRGDGEAHLTADVVTKRLKDQGFTAVTKTQEFSKESQGDFLRYEGVEEGTRVDTSTPITVVESLGPGVPKGTVGKSEADAITAVKDMGVPLSRAEVVVSSKTDVKPGDVAMTAPADGTALAKDDADRGIVLGVAAKGNGVGVDLVGEDKDTVRKALEADGFTVTMKPRFSSQQYVGKMVTSEPQPGVVSNSNNVTVYYGVDASDTQELFTDTSVYEEYGGVMKFPDSMLAGKYCKADNSDCFTLEIVQPSSREYLQEYLTASNSTIPDDSRIATNLNMLEVAPGLQEQPAAPGKTSSSGNRLIDGSSGAFELYPYGSISSAYCNGQYRLMNGGMGATCTASGWKDPDGSSSSSSWGEDRVTYRMNSYYLYYPVGTDLDVVEQTGLFDDDALNQAKSEEPVDTTRPFIVMRDPNLYDASEIKYKDAPASEYTDHADPFAPTLLNKNGKLAKGKTAFKPAPSNSSVYYLDESSLAVDWTANAKPIDSENTSVSNDSNDSSNSSDSEDKDTGNKGTSDSSRQSSAVHPTRSSTHKTIRPWKEVRQELIDGNFTQAEGKYYQKSGACVTVDAKGAVTTSQGRTVQMHYTTNNEDADMPYYNLLQDESTVCNKEAALANGLTLKDIEGYRLRRKIPAS